MTWQVTVDADEADARAVLERDRIWNCFALADLVPPFRAFTRIALAADPDSGACAACLVVQHPALRVVSPFGAAEGVAAILKQLAAEGALPEAALLQVRTEHRAVLESFYSFISPPGLIVRMATSAESFQAPAPSRLSEASPVRLTLSDLSALTALYTAYPENHFRSDLLEDGTFFGIREGTRLIAAGGTHVVAPSYHLAVLGNVFTHPAARRRGYARAITAALVADLLARGCRDVVLNVTAENEAAIRLYTGLGFREHSRYWTGQAERRG